MKEIKTIRLSLPYKLGSVNCYLVQVTDGYILIDTGHSSTRAKLEKELENAGCLPGSLKLILLTHGDFDHTGGAAYLSKKFRARIAMHLDDAGMVERGDIFYNRKRRNIMIKIIVPLFFGFGKSQRFRANLFVDEGDDLITSGWKAKVIHLPGHSKGSIGIITADNDLFCGDLLTGDKPALNSIIDDSLAADASIEKLRNLRIRTIYPGHGNLFLWEEFLRYYRK